MGEWRLVLLLLLLSSSSFPYSPYLAICLAVPP